MTTITPEIVEQHGLSPEEYERVLHALHLLAARLEAEHPAQDGR